ncbi:MAG: efflux RND transporter periplasmic adaptor subunit [Cycloclasticus sp.]|nr:efflux RND transporter periplasmic adaptor subunit [Cycloclasticus sp.]
MSKKVILLAIFIFLLFGGLFGSKFLQINKAQSSRKAPPPPVVTTTEVIEEQWENTLSSVGTIDPVLGVILSNEIAGIISILHVDSGALVSKGDLILELDTSTDRANLDGLIAAEKLALIKFKRQVTLLKNKATSRSSHDEARAELDIAKAAVISQKSIIDKKKIRAPFTGKVGIRLVSLGQYLDKGAQIAQLVSLSTIIADFAFPERHFAQLKEGQVVRLQVQAYPSEIFEGSIQAINPGLHQETRSIAVRATLNNPDEKLRAGMFADVSVVTSAPKPVLSLPETAVLFNTYGENVYIVKQQDNKNIVELRNIETGPHLNGRVQIIKGLTLGDLVINEGHVKLRNGQAVTISTPNNK